MSDKILYETEARATPRDQRAAARTTAPREAAAPTTGPRLQRRRRSHDPFFIDPKIIPQGMTYEWKMQSVYGQRYDDHWIAMRENHWKPVPADRHPELAMQGDTLIKRAGTVLCERPKYLTDEAQLEAINEGYRPVQAMEEIMYGTKPGELTRDHPSVRKSSFVRQQYAPGEPVGDGGGLSSEP